MQAYSLMHTHKTLRIDSFHRIYHNEKIDEYFIESSVFRGRSCDDSLRGLADVDGQLGFGIVESKMNHIFLP